MPSIPIYNIKAEKMGVAKLPAEIFDIEIDDNLIHRVVVSQLTNRRQLISFVKDRGEVRGGGRKPWRQKGTGRARHGSIRSPIWRAGGVTFGPTKEKTFKRKINKKMKQKALFMALTSKLRDKELVLLDKLEIKEPKTKLMAGILDNIFDKIQDTKNKKQTRSILIALSKKDKNIIRANKNIPYTKILRADSLNILNLLSFKYLLMPKDAIKIIKETYLKNAKRKAQNAKQENAKRKT